MTNSTNLEPSRRYTLVSAKLDASGSTHNQEWHDLWDGASATGAEIAAAWPTPLHALRDLAVDNGGDAAEIAKIDQAIEAGEWSICDGCVYAWDAKDEEAR